MRPPSGRIVCTGVAAGYAARFIAPFVYRRRGERYRRRERPCGSCTLSVMYSAGIRQRTLPLESAAERFRGFAPWEIRGECALARSRSPEEK